MSIVILDNFRLNQNLPLDYRIVAGNTYSRDTTIQYVYDGLKVFLTDERATYIWNQSKFNITGITSSSWDLQGGGTSAVGYNGTIQFYNSGSFGGNYEFSIFSNYECNEISNYGNTASNVVSIQYGNFRSYDAFSPIDTGLAFSFTSYNDDNNFGGYYLYNQTNSPNRSLWGIIESLSTYVTYGPKTISDTSVLSFRSFADNVTGANYISVYKDVSGYEYGSFEWLRVERSNSDAERSNLHINPYSPTDVSATKPTLVGIYSNSRIQLFANMESGSASSTGIQISTQAIQRMGPYVSGYDTQLTHAELLTNNLTQNRIFNFPDYSGTISTEEWVSSYLLNYGLYNNQNGYLTVKYSSGTDGNLTTSPSGTIYYNNVTNTFKANENGIWKDMIQAPYPVGSTLMYPGANDPSSTWVISDGRTFSRTSYPDLFNVVGFIYGGDYNTVFCIPDLRGYFVRGLNTSGSGPDFGRQLGSTQSDSVGPHNHTLPIQIDNLSLGFGSASVSSRSFEDITLGANSVTSIHISGTNSGSETRGINKALNYIIYIGTPTASLASTSIYLLNPSALDTLGLMPNVPAYQGDPIVINISEGVTKVLPLFASNNPATWSFTRSLNSNSVLGSTFGVTWSFTSSGSYATFSYTDNYGNDENNEFTISATTPGFDYIKVLFNTIPIAKNLNFTYSTYGAPGTTAWGYTNSRVLGSQLSAKVYNGTYSSSSLPISIWEPRQFNSPTGSGTLQAYFVNNQQYTIEWIATLPTENGEMNVDISSNSGFNGATWSYSSDYNAWTVFYTFTYSNSPSYNLGHGLFLYNNLY